MSKTLAKTVVQLALPNTIPSHLDNPNDRGECLVLDTDTMKRCDGRRIATREYIESEGFLIRWTCQKCRKVIVV